jgi:aromatase
MTTQQGTDTSATPEELARILTRAAGLSAAAIAAAGDATLQELGLDSLAAMELQAAVKDRYHVEIPDEPLGMSLGELDRFITARLGEASSAAGHTEQSIVIDAPFQLVWSMTNNVAGWPALFTEYAATEIIEQIGDTVTFRLTMHPDENGKVWSWVSQRRSDLPRREVHAHRVETGPFEFMKIYWSYAEQADGVRMTWVQDFHMKATAPVSDEQMTERLNRNSPVQLNVIKKKVEAAARSLADAN